MFKLSLPLVILFLLLPGRPAVAETYVLPPDGIDLVGSPHWVLTRQKDTLLDVARRYGVGYEEVVRANPGVDPWIPGNGTRVLLPTRYVLPAGVREGVVINLPEYRMYYFPRAGDETAPAVVTHPISIGRMDWTTPVGTHRVVTKVKHPSWYPPESVRKEHEAEGDILPKVVPPGPDNPLGDYAMRLSLPGYLIHGTNKPAGVGMRVTHGCIRMFPEDIEKLFPTIDVGTAVTIIDEPVKVGWAADSLVVEVHPPLEEQSEGRRRLQFTRLLREAATLRGKRVDWPRAEQIYVQATGLPVEVPLLSADMAATH